MIRRREYEEMTIELTVVHNNYDIIIYIYFFFTEQIQLCLIYRLNMCYRRAAEQNRFTYQTLSFFALCARLKQLDGELIRAGMSILRRDRAAACSPTTKTNIFIVPSFH